MISQYNSTEKINFVFLEKVAELKQHVRCSFMFTGLNQMPFTFKQSAKVYRGLQMEDEYISKQEIKSRSLQETTFYFYQYKLLFVSSERWKEYTMPPKCITKMGLPTLCIIFDFSIYHVYQKSANLILLTLICTCAADHLLHYML